MSDSLTILCAEDNPQNLLLLQKLLTDAGYRVLGAPDGPTAVGLADKERPALILVDIHLPGFDGFEAVRRIRELPGLAKVPIVALTADVIRGDRSRGLEAGFDDWIGKPFRIDSLLARIRELIEASRST
ncbi:MAG: response regulator [Deltaproteobacteria bacterium]|nr:response regulator [Deltaproteobacteria bacterium]